MDSHQPDIIICPNCRHPLPPSSDLPLEPDAPAEAAARSAALLPDRETVVAALRSGPSAAARPKRPQRTWNGSLLRLALVTICLLAAVAVVAGMPGWMPTRSPGTRFAPGTSAPSSHPSSRPPHSPDVAPAAEPPLREVGTKPVLRALDAAIVKIESDRPGDAGALGAGFVIAPGGLIATSYHVVSSATRARVRFRSGAVYDVAGYAALDPAADLAILKLQDSPPDLQPVPLFEDGDPPQLTPVVAVGHPQGIEFSTFDGTVSRVLQTSELPRRSQDFLDQLMIGGGPHRWIQHTARIAEGYSGGPLLNQRGEVIGVNIWTDRETGTGYALHADHLRRLRADLLPAIAPLDRYASDDARAALLVERLSAPSLTRLLDDARAMKWWPANTADYEKLQQLAWAVTIANQPGTMDGDQRPGGLSATDAEDVVRAADQIVAAIRNETWGAPAQMIVINEFAADQVDRANRGVFFFGTVQRTVSGRDGSRAALVTLAGLDRSLFIPLDGQLLDPAPGTSCLIMGVNYQGRVVRYGDNPLQPIVAPVIVSRTIIPLAE